MSASDLDPYRHVEQAREELSCDEHEPTLYVCGGNYGRCCKRCGKRLIDGWIPHSELSEAQMEGAIENREDIMDAHKQRKNDRISELRREEKVPFSFEELCPEKDASAAEWLSAFKSTSQVLDSKKREHFFWSLYSEYMKSEAWAQTRTRVYENKGRECTAKLHVCEKEATQVHHISYDHIGREPLWELTPICSACHDAIHDRDAPSSQGEASPEDGEETPEDPNLTEDTAIDKAIEYSDLFGAPDLS